MNAILSPFPTLAQGKFSHYQKARKPATAIGTGAETTLDCARWWGIWTHEPRTVSAGLVWGQPASAVLRAEGTTPLHLNWLLTSKAVERCSTGQPTAAVPTRALGRRTSLCA